MAFRIEVNNHNYQKYLKADQATEFNYDRLSKWYDLLAMHSERQAQTSGLNLLDAKEGDTVLEIGFGTGQNLLSLARKVNPSLPTKVCEWAQRKFSNLIDCRPIHAQVLVSNVGFLVQKVSELSMWGLLVHIVLAEKK